PVRARVTTLARSSTRVTLAKVPATETSTMLGRTARRTVNAAAPEQQPGDHKRDRGIVAGAALAATTAAGPVAETHIVAARRVRATTAGRRYRGPRRVTCADRVLDRAERERAGRSRLRAVIVGDIGAHRSGGDQR